MFQIKPILKLSIISIAIFLGNTAVHAYDDRVTHPALTEKAISVSSLDTHLKQFLSPQFASGITTTLNGAQVVKLLTEGSQDEDALICRRSTHFHNPLMAWDKAGMNEVLMNPWCPSYQQPGSFGKYSALVWATGYETRNGPINSNRGAGDAKQQMGWDYARSYFHAALTSPTSFARDDYFARTFQAVGQVLHLLQDMAVPAHVRNDFIASHLIQSGMANPYESFVTNPEIFSASTQTAIKPAFSDIITSDYWDKNIYTGAAQIPITSTTIGLSEYTNANFMSEATIFKDFPYPVKSNTTASVVETLAEDGQRDWRWYIYENERTDELAAYSYFAFEQIPAQEGWEYILDEKVYKAEAQLLLPRAVGYSAALIDYFFRGKLDLVSAGTNSSYIIVNNTDEPMDGTFRIFYDNATNTRIQLWTGTLTLGAFGSGANQSAPITLNIPDQDSPLTLVFRGKLGNETDAVAGKVIRNDLYFLVMPVDPATRQGLGKNYYRLNGTTLEPVAEQSLPFGLLDDGAYWDETSQSWSIRQSSESLGIPLSIGGPQYLAKYWDDPNRRVRYVPNGSFEKEAYQGYHLIWPEINPSDPNCEILKDYYALAFIGSPAHDFGSNQGNGGWMEYTDSGLFTILSTPSTQPRTQRNFPLYQTVNFNDIYIETPAFRSYGFNGSITEHPIPKDPDAPLPSIVAANRPTGANYVEAAVPAIFTASFYTDLSTRRAEGLGSSGYDYYRIRNDSVPPEQTGHADKCAAEDANCGIAYDKELTEPIIYSFDIPSDYNSKVHVTIAPGGSHYEELYVNGVLVESTSSVNELQTHYQILAVHKDVAFVRRTQLQSYHYGAVPYRPATGVAIVAEQPIVDNQWDYRATYSSRYDLEGVTMVHRHRLSAPDHDMGLPYQPTWPLVSRLQQGAVDDITGYHLDRIFISKTLDGRHALVAFDEYAYNNGAGLEHELRFEVADCHLNDPDAQPSVLYYGIAPDKLQNCDHEGQRTGRKLLLFNADGTLKSQLQDPIGLGLTVGSIGILN
jgi:hypothetical protein